MTISHDDIHCCIIMIIMIDHQRFTITSGPHLDTSVIWVGIPIWLTGRTAVLQQHSVVSCTNSTRLLMAPGHYLASAKEVVWTVDWHGDIGKCSSCLRTIYSRMAFLRQHTIWDGLFSTMTPSPIWIWIWISHTITSLQLTRWRKYLWPVLMVLFWSADIKDTDIILCEFELHLITWSMRLNHCLRADLSLQILTSGSYIWASEQPNLETGHVNDW